MGPKAKSVAVALGLASFSAVLVGCGLLGPLTPSEGKPSAAAWAICGGLPLLLTVFAVAIAKDWIVRLALLIELAWFLKITLDALKLFRIV
jgi:hypothetical protein